jgi:hypothetical protein
LSSDALADGTEGWLTLAGDPIAAVDEEHERSCWAGFAGRLGSSVAICVTVAVASDFVSFLEGCGAFAAVERALRSWSFFQR